MTMTRYERFGVRKLEVRGKELYLNGHPFFVRGFGDNQQFPLTGTTPPDRTLHRRHLAAKTCPDGRREVFVSGLDVSSGTVEGDSLLANLVRWAAGER